MLLCGGNIVCDLVQAVKCHCVKLKFCVQRNMICDLVQGVKFHHVLLELCVGINKHCDLVQGKLSFYSVD